jgi:hypothetical protein
MYATEYDLMVASDRLRDRRDEMRAIRLARAAQAEAIVRPSLLDRLIALATGGAQVQAPHGNVGAAA